METMLSQREVDHWEFPIEKLRLTETILGSGAFGIVKKGIAEGIKNSNGEKIVAVKYVKG